MSDLNPKLWSRTKPQLQTDFLIREKMLNWLGNIKNKKILDAGCGEGYLTRKLLSSGAIVDAFDIDPEMIRLAKRTETDKRANYKVGDIRQVDKLYPKNTFDIAVVSGVICFLNERELYKTMQKIYKIIKLGGKVVIAANHAKSYFKKSKSGWLEYLSKPDINQDTQKVRLNFNNPNGKALFKGFCFFHTPKRIREALLTAKFRILKTYEPLATKEDMKHFPHMWVDEDKIPFHIVMIAIK